MSAGLSERGENIFSRKNQVSSPCHVEDGTAYTTFIKLLAPNLVLSPAVNVCE